MKEMRTVLIAAGTCLAIAIIGAMTFWSRDRANDMIGVTGMGRMDFASDRVVWSGNLQVQAKTLEKAYDALVARQGRVDAFLKASGIKDSETVWRQVGMEKMYGETRNGDGAIVARPFEGYALFQQFVVDSGAIDTVEKASRDVTSLLKEGIELSSDLPQFFYTKLPELKLELIALATQDARARAGQIAKNAGTRLGKVRYSSLGVFQILGQSSSQESSSWEGYFDTESRLKTATVTVRVQYEAK